MCSDLELALPRLSAERYLITSPKAKTYNCVAWAAGEVTRWWEPDPYHQHYWPMRTRNRLVETYKKAFESIGYASCGLDATVEPGFEKVAIYASGFHATHMARQLPSGEWTSKCGRLEDIVHALEGLEGLEYGSVAVIMRRKRPRA